jgi:tetratricopeptide (TPR) repeat protein
MTEQILTAEDLRQKGLASLRANDPEASIPCFDDATALATSDELRELISINKSFALITLGRGGDEVLRLPRIVMRRSNPRHVFLAAYNLQYKFRLEGDFKRAANYLRVAMQAVEEAGEPAWKPRLHQELGNLAVLDSRTDEALEQYAIVLSLIGEAPEFTLTRAFTYQNFGYSKLVAGQLEDGIAMIHRAIDLMKESGNEGFIAESYIDLCYGYLEQNDLPKALEYGLLGESLATEVRQVRNVHYLLGEVAHKLGDRETAEAHFDALATFYPDFPHLKDVLLALDLRKMVNLKL